DKAKHNVLPPSKFGVVEITRQRVREVTDISTEEKCPCCNGTGEAQASILITDQIENNIRYLFEDGKQPNLVLKVHPFIEAYINKGIVSMRRRWMFKYKKNIKVVADMSYSYLQFKFFNIKGEEINL